MDDQIVTPIRLTSAFRTALARAWLRGRRSIVRHRPREKPADFTDLSDWMLSNIGVSPERNMSTGLEADPAARQFWRP